MSETSKVILGGHSEEFLEILETNADEIFGSNFCNLFILKLMRECSDEFLKKLRKILRFPRISVRLLHESLVESLGNFYGNLSRTVILKIFS